MARPRTLGGDRKTEFYSRLVPDRDREALRSYVPVNRYRFPEAYGWWSARTRGAYPRPPERVQELYSRAFAWAEANVAGFPAHDTRSPLFAEYIGCIRALARMFTVCEERDMAFEFVFPHAMLMARNRYLQNPAALLASDDVLDNIRMATGENPMHAIHFGDDELARLDHTRQLRDACTMRVPLHLDCTRRQFANVSRLPLRGVVFGPRDLAHVQYVDPYVMVVKFATYQNTSDGRRVAMAFGASKRADEAEGKATSVHEVLATRPLPQAGTGVYTEADFLGADDMACALLIRRNDVWVGVVRSRTRLLCNVSLDPQNAFNLGALGELDVQPTHAEVIGAFAESTIPDDVLDMMDEFAGLDLVQPRPAARASGAAAADPGSKRKQ